MIESLNNLSPFKGISTLLQLHIDTFRLKMRLSQDGDLMELKCGTYRKINQKASKRVKDSLRGFT